MFFEKNNYIFAKDLILTPNISIVMRGGSRPGAGRPRIYGKRVQLSILISEETKDKLKQLATARNKPLAGIVEQLIIDGHRELTLS